MSHAVRRNTVLLSACLLTLSGVLQLAVAVATITLVLETGIQSILGLGPAMAWLLTAALAAALAVPMVIGIGRLAGRLGRVLAETALPKARSGVDFDKAPRRSLEITIQITVVMVVSVVILALSQPFLPGYAGPILFVGLLGAFGIALWRSAADLDGHVRAGSEAVVDALKHYAHAEPTAEYEAITKVQDLMPGLGSTVSLQLTAECRGVGKSLGELDLRGRTGATVLAIRRDGKPIPNPTAGDRLQAGDLLALTGTADALAAARAALVG